jgi:prefoldin subunit 5
MDELERAADELEKATNELVKRAEELAKRSEELNRQLLRLAEALTRPTMIRAFEASGHSRSGPTTTGDRNPG